MTNNVELQVRSAIAAAQRVVIKLGSALVTEPEEGLAIERIDALCAQVAVLLERGVQAVVVSSGAVAEGMHRLGLSARPTRLAKLQASAAVGQIGLARTYERAFARHNRGTALVLLTHDDFANRRRYLNARSTLDTLMQMGVTPIINENDSVATEEIRFGDNDTLAAMVTSLVSAELLILLTDQSGLHRRDPNTDPSAALVPFAYADDAALDAMASSSTGAFGRGGMSSKVGAARLAARSGAHTVIANGRAERVIEHVMGGAKLGSVLASRVRPLEARKRWIADQANVRGSVVLDAGAVVAVASGGSSLLPVGVVGVRGDFRRGDVVNCESSDGTVIAKGLVNYSAAEAARLQGVASEQIGGILGYEAEPELIHRDNLVVLSGA